MKRDEQHRKGKEKRGEQNGRTRKGGLGTGRAETMAEREERLKQRERKERYDIWGVRISFQYVSV